MALSTLLAGLRATRIGAVAAAAALATTSVVAAGATLPDQAADRAQEALDHAAEASAADDDDNGIDTIDIDDNGDDNGHSEDVIEVLGGGEFTPEDGQDFGQAVAEQAREQEQGSFGQAVADAARGEDDDDEDDDEVNGPAADLPEQAEKRGDNAGDARP